MAVANQVLWNINNEYRKRLSQAQTLLNLLEQLLLMQGDARQEHTLAALAYVREQIDLMNEEHRRWRHQFYYESLDTRRMVQDSRAIDRALARFSRMRTDQERRLQDICNLVYDLPRPDTHLTTVPTGDLWTMTQYALRDLLTFDHYLSEMNPVSH
ncbi:MAG: hypothetical protein HZC41_26450 [Chloroflexi bacterium]|nr:hypothetical protein [Chloroflexota bacterium]